MRKLIRFTDTGNGYYIEENNDTDVFVPITLYNAEIVANIMFKKLSKTGTAIYRWDGIIPKNVLNFVTNEDKRKIRILWYIEPSKRFLSSNKKGESGIVYYPRTVMFYNHNNLEIYAVKDRTITERTKLYKFPFPNMFQSNNLCFGSTSVSEEQDRTLNAIIDDMELSLFSSKYSHGLSTAPMHHKDPKEVFMKMFNGKLKRFPTKVLIDTKMEIRDLIKKLNS